MTDIYIYIYLENLQIGICENMNKLTLKEINELYGEDYVPPYFVKNGGGRIYPFSEFWKQKLIQLDSFIGAEIEQRKRNCRIFTRLFKNLEKQRKEKRQNYNE